MPEPEPQQRVTVVTVAYNSMAVLPAMLSSLPSRAPLVIVDNAPVPDPALDALTAQHGARLLRPGRNLGFGTGCNLGAAIAETEFLFFLNPDTTLADDCIERLVAAMDAYPGAVAMNPRITGGGGKPYFKRRSVLLPRKAWLARGWPDADREVPVLSGAALMVRKSDFDAVGGFDPAIFLYHEDDDLSLRLVRAGGRLMFIRGAEALHAQGMSSGQSAEVAAFKGSALGRSRVYATRKHGIRFSRQKAVIEALAALFSPANLLSSRKRSKTLAYLRGVLH